MQFYAPSYVTLTALLLVALQAMAHKEERFLYPVYPLLCLAAAFALRSLSMIAKQWKEVCHVCSPSSVYK